MSPQQWRVQLNELARWLGLEKFEVISRRGELLRELRRQRGG